MSGNLVYIARPIDLGRVDPNLYDYTVGELLALGFTSYNPLGAFNVSSTPSGVVNAVNEAAMLSATGAVAFLPSYAKSVGVPAEISFLLAHGVPTLIVSDLGSTSWVVAGWSEGALSEVVDLTEEGISAGIDWLKLTMDSVRLVNSLRSGPYPITFEKKHEAATLPTKGYDLDAGYDLYAVEAVTIPAQGQGQVSCGVAVDIPEGMWAQVTGRSSTLKNLNLMVAPTVGVIDEEYTGELFIPVVSISKDDVKIEAGQRIAQLILHTAPGQRYQPVWGTTRDKARGSNGFGSTGR